MHCAAMNNHTDIIEYIINDLQMKELDKEDNVSTHFPPKFNCNIDPSFKSMIQISVRKPAIRPGCRDRLCGNAGDAEE